MRLDELKIRPGHFFFVFARHVLDVADDEAQIFVLNPNFVLVKQAAIDELGQLLSCQRVYFGGCLV